MLGDQRRVLVLMVNHRGRSPVQLGAVGFELGLVGHRADQRMPKRILRERGEPHLIDQLGPDQFVNDRLDTQVGQQLSVKPQADHCRRAQRALGLPAETIDTCGDGRLQGGRNTNLGHIGVADIAAASTPEYSPFGEVANQGNAFQARWSSR